jgi:two-component system, cell cycle response regulator
MGMVGNMPGDQILKEIINRPAFISNLYDTVRLVDPVHKIVSSCLKSDSTGTTLSSGSCYEMWGKDSICDNCISMRSFNKKRTTVKIEFGNSKIYMVTAVPIENQNQSSIVELIKDITHDGVINVEGLEPTELNKLISQKNESIIKDAITKIYNEDYIFERLPHDIISSKRKGGSLALFLIKLANIESLDKSLRKAVIKETARVINSISNQPRNWSSRFGESDFVLVLHDINDTKAKRVSQRLNKKINNLELNSLFEDLHINIGYHIVFDTNIPPETIIQNAERMISVSKSTVTKNGLNERYEHFFDKYSLTSREREVALLLMKIKSNSEIADSLFVGLSTVKKHVSSVFHKTNSKSRAELIAKINALIE